MKVNVNLVLSTAVSFLKETVVTQKIKYAASKNEEDLMKIYGLIADLGFQVDFPLMASVVEIQDLYDSYRIKLAGESNIEIRTILKLTNHIHNFILDEYGDTNNNPWNDYITRLAQLLTLHSDVKLSSTFQDESILSGMNIAEWANLLENNPWLVAVVSVHYIPSYYLMSILMDLDATLPTTETVP